MKNLIKNYLKDIKMTEKNIKRKNLASSITLVVELVKVILTFIFLSKISFVTSIIIFVFAILSTSTALFLLYNDDYNEFKKYIVLDLSTLIFFISNIVSGIIIESISYDADKNLLKKIVKPVKKIKKLTNELYHSKLTYLYLFLSLIICYEKLYINGYVFMILTILTLIAFFIKDIKKSIKEFNTNKKNYILFILKNYLITLIIANTLALIAFLIIGEDSTNEQLLQTEPTWRLLLTSVIYAPIAEELLFRGCLRKLIKNDKIFILVSGITFGLWHVVGHDQSLIQYLYVFTYSTMGIGLSYVYSKTNNLMTNIGMHFIHNVLANITNFIA